MPFYLKGGRETKSKQAKKIDLYLIFFLNQIQNVLLIALAVYNGN